MAAASNDVWVDPSLTATTWVDPAESGRSIGVQIEWEGTWGKDPEYAGCWDGDEWVGPPLESGQLSRNGAG